MRDTPGGSPTPLPKPAARRQPFALGAMPVGRAMETIDERLVRAPMALIFDIVRAVEHWPAYLGHYRHVRFRDPATDGGGVVEMSANRPFGPLDWPTWWLSEMSVDHAAPNVRFRHIGGITTGMDVEWGFRDVPGGTHVRLVHVWDGPTWPLVGVFAATAVIGPIFIHGIASRTLEGLGRAAERQAGAPRTGEHPVPTVEPTGSSHSLPPGTGSS